MGFLPQEELWFFRMTSKQSYEDYMRIILRANHLTCSQMKREKLALLTLRAWNNGQSTDNVWTDWIHLASHADWSHLIRIVLKMNWIKISVLFSCFSCYQYVAGHCVLQNYDLKSWVKCNYKCVFTICALRQTSRFMHFWSQLHWQNFHFY